MKKLMSSQIFWPTVIMFVIALALFIIALLQGEGKHVTGLKSAWTFTIQILPLLIFALIVAGRGYFWHLVQGVSVRQSHCDSGYEWC